MSLPSMSSSGGDYSFEADAVVATAVLHPRGQKLAATPGFQDPSMDSVDFSGLADNRGGVMGSGPDHSFGAPPPQRSASPAPARSPTTHPPSRFGLAAAESSPSELQGAFSYDRATAGSHGRATGPAAAHQLGTSPGSDSWSGSLGGAAGVGGDSYTQAAYPPGPSHQVPAPHAAHQAARPSNNSDDSLDGLLSGEEAGSAGFMQGAQPAPSYRQGRTTEMLTIAGRPHSPDPYTTHPPRPPGPDPYTTHPPRPPAPDPWGYGLDPAGPPYPRAASPDLPAHPHPPTGRPSNPVAGSFPGQRHGRAQQQQLGGWAEGEEDEYGTSGGSGYGITADLQTSQGAGEEYDDDEWNGEIGEVSFSPDQAGGRADRWPRAASPARSPRPLTPQARVEVAVREALGRPVTSWDVRDVCNWVQAIGFPQYRTKFAHNSVKGDLLLRLTDDELARQLGILPLGHRQALRDKIDELKAWVPPEGYAQQASSPRHNPASPDLLLPEPFLGPAQGKVRAEEQRDRLRYEMERARKKAAQANIVLEQVARVKALADEEKLRLLGQLQVVDQKAQQRSRRRGEAGGGGAAPLLAPWLPNNYMPPQRHPERNAGPGDDPALDLTFKPRITRLHEVPSEDRGTVEAVYIRPSMWTRMKNTARTREELEKKKKELIAEAGQSTKLQELQEEAEDIKDNKAGKAEAVAGFWRPGGVVRRRKEATPHLTEDQKLSNDVVFLMKKLWGWGHPTLPRRAISAVETPYPALLTALDDLIDALLHPDNMGDSFALKVRAFFKESNLDIHMHKESSDNRTFSDPFLKRLQRLKTFDNFSKLDEVELKLRETAPGAKGRAKKAKDSSKGTGADIIKQQRKNLKVRSIAGLVHMAELVARAYGRRKDSDESGSGSDEDKDARKKKAQARKQKGRGKAVQEGKFGPFVPNGVLKRDANSAKAWDLLGKRMAHHRQKVGMGAITLDASKQDEKARDEALSMEVAKADSLFRLLGWGEDLSDPDGSTGELINRLLRRALHVAELREHQVNVLRRAKAEKAERLRELNLQLSRVSQVSNEGKGLLARIAQLKAMQLVVEDPEPVDWDDEPWRQDELQELQQRELERQQRSIARRMARRREKRQHDQALHSLRGQHDDLMDWEVEDLVQVQQMVALPQYVALLGQMSSKDLLNLMRLPPSGLAQNQEAVQDEEAAKGLRMEHYDVQDKGRAGGRLVDEELLAARRRAEAIKALKLKKVKVYRALTTRQFVEGVEEGVKNKERRMARVLEDLDQELVRARSPSPDPEAKPAFLQRQLDDLEYRREAAQQRQAAALQLELSACSLFQARPLGATSRSSSPGSTPAHPYYTGMSQEGGWE
ncbi:hypothetical protein V8C86DRAFT_3144871, partial [Haematococcus lacustris]